LKSLKFIYKNITMKNFFSKLKKRRKKRQKETPFEHLVHQIEVETRHLLKNFVFVILLSVFILISTIGIHEFGHVIAANHYGCEYRTILFEEGTSPYTEIFCPDGKFNKMIILAGPLLPILLASLLIIVGGKFVREMALMILGFNFILTYRDFTDLGFPESIKIGVIILGTILFMTGIILLNHERFKLGIGIPFLTKSGKKAKH